MFKRIFSRLNGKLCQYWILDEADQFLGRHRVEFFNRQAILIANFRQEHLPYLLCFCVVSVTIGIAKSVVNDAKHVTPWFWVSLLEKYGLKGNEKNNEECKHSQAFSCEVDEKEVDGIVRICKDCVLWVATFVKDHHSILCRLALLSIQCAHERFGDNIECPLSIVIGRNELVRLSIFTRIETFVVVDSIDQRTSISHEEHASTFFRVAI